MGKHSGGAFALNEGTGEGGKMKVTVKFGPLGVIVPCGNPEMTVSDLIHQATLRYKKAAGKGPDSYVLVHKLTSNGGILDPDDKLMDVADDREQIMAVFEEDADGIPSLQHNAGDGTSASSVGTNSPDIFQGSEHKFQPFARTDIEITGEELDNAPDGLSLQVRRGSEPALNRLSPLSHLNGSLSVTDPSKRWSAAPVIDEDKHDISDRGESSVATSSSTVYEVGNNNCSGNSGSGSVKEHYTKNFMRNKSAGNVNSNSNNSNSRFSRDSNRLSMQFFGDGSAKWADAADRAMCLSLRADPVGANASPPRSSCPQETRVQVIIPYGVGDLGIYLVPDYNSEDGRNQGLIVRDVQADGRIARSRALSPGDKIVGINGTSLIGVPSDYAKELFRSGIQAEECRLEVIKPASKENEESEELVSNVDGDDMVCNTEEKIVGESRIATLSSTRRSGPIQPASALIASNTRKIGKKYEVDLQKGPQGLGFSITTRDNPAGGNCPICIKNILPHGAAIDEGSLRPGDRLLEVNGIEITGKTQAEAVSILKNIPLGGFVKLIVSRQERVDLSPKLPRQIPPEKITEDLQPVPWSEKEFLQFDIPVLETEKAGLGISVKGKTATSPTGGMIDMGIFIKGVISGGAASRDARLKSNDQLLSVNGVSLLNCSNTHAMETLRKTMTMDGGPKPKPGFITLKIARRVPSSSAPTTDLGSSGSGDEMDSWAAKNVSMTVDGSRNEVSPPRAPQIFIQQQTQRMPSNDDIVMQSPSNSMQNIMNRSRSSSLRKIDVLKGKFEQNANANTNQFPPRVPLELPRNPVLERLTGKNGSNNQPANSGRNESYFKATNLNEVSPSPQGFIDVGDSRNYRNGYNSNTNSNGGLLVGHVNGETVLIEDDYSAPRKPPRRSRSSTPEDTLDSRSSRPQSNVQQPAPSDVTYASQTSLEDAGGFSRDAFGRQSMSEKRHATLDAKSTDTYQRNKKLKEERERIRQEEKRKLAAERNLQDQWARRGLKRPFSSSTEDELELGQLSPRSLSSCGSPDRSRSLSPNPQPLGSRIANAKLSKGKPGDRLGLGDQLLQLLHHWGQRRGAFTSCIACGGDGKTASACSGTYRQELQPGALARVNSADSLVDSLKNANHHTVQVHHQSSSRHARSNGKPKKDIGPSLGMKKSSSLESLQTMVQEIVVEEDMRSGYVPPRSGPQAVKVIRGRGCNESFRQAVDRSYEAPIGGLETQMETLAEEETESCVSGPSSSRNVQFEEVDEKVKTIKKKQGLFRGLGSMFRFGRHRKPGQGPKGVNGEHEGHYGSNIDPIQEQYRRLAEKRDARVSAYGTTSSASQRQSNDYTDERLPTRGQQQQPHPYSAGSGSMRLKKSSGKSNQQNSQNQNPGDINGNPSNSSHARSASASYDQYPADIVNRPGSRVGFAIAADPKKYSHSHYINYDEIKQHLNLDHQNREGLNSAQLRQMRATVEEQRKKAILESRRHQQHYHSQRRETPTKRSDRPVSNFYEYESIQAAMHAQQQNANRMSTIAMQNQNLTMRNNNNGITLPSPTVPLGLVHQLSASQFQPGPNSFQGQGQSQLSGRNGNIENYHSQSQIQSQQQQRRVQQGQNSLPRRHHKEQLNYNQSPPSNQQLRQHNTLQPQQISMSSSSSGRYAHLTPPPQGSYSQQQMQMHHPNNYSQYQQQNSPHGQQQTSLRHQNYSSHNLSVGSKV